MKMSPFKINLFLLFKLPSAFFCGVRLKSISDNKCITSVKYRWISQNPFGSMFWAVQGMAAELATGALVLKKINESGEKISMLVANNNATFSKKAKGRINFSCVDGVILDSVIENAIATKEGQLINLKATGFDKNGDEVASFNFQWTLKLKK